MSWFAKFLATLFLLYLVTRAPLSLLLIRLKVWHPRFRSRTDLYLSGMLETCLSLVPCTLSCLVLGWSPQVLGLQLPTHILFAIFFLASALLFSALTVFGMYWLVRVSPEERASLSQPAPSSTLQPQTTTERWLFVPDSLIMGVIEELLYRGFLLAYLTRFFPGIPIVPAILVAAGLFGLGHLAQRWGGMIGNGLIGLALCWLYMVTGSLFPGMLVHVFFNLRQLLMPRHSRGLKETFTGSTPGTVSASSAAKSE